MVYRKVSMIEVKEILTRVARGQTKRKIRRDLSVHGLTINRYIEEANLTKAILVQDTSPVAVSSDSYVSC